MAKVYKKAAGKVKEGSPGKFADHYAPKGKSGIVVQGSYKANTKVTIAEEPLAVYTSRIRAIGNSKGVILNNNLIESAGLKQDIDIVIQAKEGVIIIMQTKETGVNTNLASWDKQFKAAIKKGAKPEGDMFEGMNNDFDKKNGSMKQFDVYLVDLDPTRGAEMKKTRPAVIISPDAMNKNLKTVLIAPLTHTVKGYPSRVASIVNGQAGEIVLDQVRGVDKTRLKKKAGVVDAATASKIKAVLATMFS